MVPAIHQHKGTSHVKTYQPVPSSPERVQPGCNRKGRPEGLCEQNVNTPSLPCSPDAVRFWVQCSLISSCLPYNSPYNLPYNGWLYLVVGSPPPLYCYRLESSL